MVRGVWCSRCKPVSPTKCFDMTRLREYPGHSLPILGFRRRAVHDNFAQVRHFGFLDSLTNNSCWHLGTAERGTAG